MRPLPRPPPSSSPPRPRPRPRPPPAPGLTAPHLLHLPLPHISPQWSTLRETEAAATAVMLRSTVPVLPEMTRATQCVNTTVRQHFMHTYKLGRLSGQVKRGRTLCSCSEQNMEQCLGTLARISCAPEGEVDVPAVAGPVAVPDLLRRCNAHPAVPWPLTMWGRRCGRRRVIRLRPPVPAAELRQRVQRIHVSGSRTLRVWRRGEGPVPGPRRRAWRCREGLGRHRRREAVQLVRRRRHLQRRRHRGWRARIVPRSEPAASASAIIPGSAGIPASTKAPAAKTAASAEAAASSTAAAAARLERAWLLVGQAHRQHGSCTRSAMQSRSYVPACDPHNTQDADQIK